MEILLISILSYFVGSIPFGFILTKIFLKKDIRDVGSGNIGATNVLRTGNKLIGYGTLFLDVIKAVIPVIYIKFKNGIINNNIIFLFNGFNSFWLYFN